ncbi:hypothetical protein PC128_g25788 [Phytophthora cactorum]|nr:hypothetical protein PC128_g25788 [Phytophthora cactorum]
MLSLLDTGTPACEQKSIVSGPSPDAVIVMIKSADGQSFVTLPPFLKGAAIRHPAYQTRNLHAFGL